MLDYVRLCWSVIEPQTKYLDNWHIELICEYLELVTSGKIKRLIINIPPRYMKSSLISIFWPTWSWTRDPHLRFLFASYADELALKHNTDRRTILNSQWYKGQWGDKVKLAGDQNQKGFFQNTIRGHMLATSVGGGSTGFGGNVIVLDDPLNPKMALSDTVRNTTNQWIGNTISTRLDDKRNGAIVVIMQRLHHDDVTGYLLRQMPDEWTHVELKGEAEKPERHIFPVSGKVVERSEGDVLWPCREDKDILALQKRQMGSYDFASHYQQNPVPLGGSIIKKEWLRYYQNDLPPIVAMDQIIQSWDMSFKNVGDSSFVVGQVWGKFLANKYLLDQVRARMGFTETIRAVKMLIVRWPQTQTILVEDKANGPAVIDSLKNELSGILPINPEGSKGSRLHAVSRQFESGNIYIPHSSIAPWVEQYIDELCNYPFVAHDDQCDSTSQALSWLPKHSMSISDFKNSTYVGGRLTSSVIDW